MTAYFITIATIFGLIIGSFLNVVILRMNTGRGIGGRSGCMSCGKTLHWYELIPVFSFLIQRGKCRSCKSPVSWQYPLVEATTALLFAGIAWNIHEPLRIAAWALLVSIGMVISVYDLKHRMIPIYPLIAFFAISLVIGFHWLALIVVPLPFFIIWAVSKGAWIGFGDVEIMAIMGSMFGLFLGFSAVAVSFWAACLIVIPITVVMSVRKMSRNPQIPLGPFLFAGIYIVGVLGLDVFRLIAGMVQ